MLWYNRAAGNYGTLQKELFFVKSKLRKCAMLTKPSTCKKNTGDIFADPVFQNKKAKVVFKNSFWYVLAKYIEYWYWHQELFHLLVKNVYDTWDIIHHWLWTETNRSQVPLSRKIRQKFQYMHFCKHVWRISIFKYSCLKWLSCIFVSKYNVKFACSS